MSVHLVEYAFRCRVRETTLGAWGSGPFENDGALDFVGWVQDTERGERPDFFRGTFETVIDNGDQFLDIDDASFAVAAAAIVASELTGGRFAEEVDAPDAVRAAGVLDVPADLPLLALRALDYVAGEKSELRGVWEEGDSPFNFALVLQPIRDVLSSAARLDGETTQGR
jgi:hypothetical protein